MNAVDERSPNARNKTNYIAAKAAFNARELDRCLAFYAREHQIMSRPTPAGREHIRAFLEGTLAGWPDLRLEVAQVVAEDDWVMGRCVVTATHTTAVMGVAPTGEQVVTTFWDLHRFDEAGLIVQTWNLMDVRAVWREDGDLAAARERYRWVLVNGWTHENTQGDSIAFIERAQGNAMRLPILKRALILSSVGLSGCQTGFSLPKGNEAMGKAAFVKYRCADCHTIVGMNDLRLGFEPFMTLPLGGRTEDVKTYAELVTSIINPSHVISPNFPGEDVSVGGRSRMPNYNHAMSVNELIDLVTFLEGQYELDPYWESDYDEYIYPTDW